MQYSFLKKIFLYIVISSFFLLFSGCVPRQSNDVYYNDDSCEPCYNMTYKVKDKSTPFDSLKVKEQKREILRNPFSLKRLTPNRREIKPLFNTSTINSNKKESAFDKILKLNRDRKIEKKHKVKYNNSQEEFPSNVPIGSVR